MALRRLLLVPFVSLCAVLVVGCSATAGSASSTPVSTDGGADRTATAPDPSGAVAVACPTQSPTPSRLADVVAEPRAAWTTVCLVSGPAHAVQSSIVGDPLYDAIRTAGAAYRHPCALVARFPRPFVVLAYADGSQRALSLDDDCGMLLGADTFAFLSPHGRGAVARVLAPVEGTRVVLGGMSLSLPSGWAVVPPEVCGRAPEHSVSVWPRWPVGAACPNAPIRPPSPTPAPPAAVDLHPFTAFDVPAAPWQARTTWNGQLAYLTRASQGAGPVATYTTELVVPSLDAVLVISGVDATTTDDLLVHVGMVWPGGVRPAGVTAPASSAAPSRAAAPTAMPS